MKKLLFFSLLVATLFSCAKETEVISSIFIPNEIKINIDKIQQVTVSYNPSNLLAPTYTWKSSNETIFKVSTDGVITGIGVGEATLTVTVNGLNLSSTSKIKVLPIVATGIMLNPTRANLVLEDSLQIIAIFLPENVTDKTINWKSADANIATVSDKGIVKAKGLGNTSITAESGGFKANCEIVVEPVKVTGLSLNKTSLSLLVGKSETLTATVSPSNATDKSVTWTSSNANIVTVTDQGVVTAVGDGKATIKAESGALFITCEVNVSSIKVKEISILNFGAGSNIFYIEVGKDSDKPIVEIQPSDATNKEIIWSSNNKNIFTVNSDGIVHGVSVGSAILTGASKDGGAKIEMTVNVIPIQIQNLMIIPRSRTMIVSDIFQLNVEIVPSNAQFEKLYWGTYDSSIAEVNQSGVLRAIRAGQTSAFVNTDGYVAVSVDNFCSVVVKNSITDFVNAKIYKSGTSTQCDESGCNTISKFSVTIFNAFSDPIEVISYGSNTFKKDLYMLLGGNSTHSLTYTLVGDRTILDASGSFLIKFRGNFYSVSTNP